MCSLELLNVLLKEKPFGDNAWVLRALAKWDIDDRGGARADISQAIQLRPKNISANRVRAHFRPRMDDKKGALSDLIRARHRSRAGNLRETPKRRTSRRHLCRSHAERFVARAALHHESRDNAAAISDVKQAIAWAPDNTDARLLLGNCTRTAASPRRS